MYNISLELLQKNNNKEERVLNYVHTTRTKRFKGEKSFLLSHIQHNSANIVFGPTTLFLDIL